MKSRLLLSVLFLSLCFTTTVLAADKEEEKRQEYRKKVAEKLAELNGSSWDVRVNSSTGKGILVGNDTLTFQDQKFASENASKEGWTSTNYTLTVPENEDAPIVWETMQTSSKAGVAFWRGEWKEEVMTGVISRQIEDKNEEYSFTSSATRKISPTSGKEETAQETVSDSISQAPLVSGANISTIPETAPPSEQPETAQQAKPAVAPKKTSWFF
jgi:hypothetical protein